MSALGSYDACNTICGCYDCRFEINPGIDCNPCINCSGKHWDELNETDIEYGECGYYYREESCTTKERYEKHKKCTCGGNCDGNCSCNHR